MLAVSGWSGKSLASWSAAPASARRSWPIACTSRSAASSAIRPPCRRTSAETKRENSEGFSEADFTSVTAAALRSLVSSPEPFWPPECTRISPTSSAGAAAYSTRPSWLSSGRSTSPRTIPHLMELNRDGAARSPSPAMLIWSAVVSLTSDSGSAARTALTAASTLRWLRTSSGPVTSVTFPRTSDARAEDCGDAMMRVSLPHCTPFTRPRGVWRLAVGIVSERRATDCGRSPMHPDVIGGRYRVGRAIGRGGMGTVWLCRDEKLERDVAVKQVGLLPGQSVTASARALREARSSAALSHRNVVTVFDVVEEDGAIWLVMEHVPSRSLSELIKQEGPLDPARVAGIGAQVADGLAAAHAVGTMHRDVKPGNGLVREDGLAKISDFGIARSLGDPALTQSGLLTGTPLYFSPELARGAAPNPASDVWALGATLYAAVEGRPPYRPHENPVAVLHDIATQQPPAPRRAAFLEPVLLRMMDRNPDSRWSMADAAHALRRLAREHSPENTRAETLVAAAPGPHRPVTPKPEQRAARAVASAPAAAGSEPPEPVDPPPDEPRGHWGAYAALAALALLIVVAGVV